MIKDLDYNSVMHSNAGVIYTGKNFVITGELSIPHEEIVKEIEFRGGTILAEVSSITDYLIIGEKVGATKIGAAEIAGTRVITEEELQIS
ncbi:hypothetical protein AEA09_03945 [Lysinibacillus contaminans]|uniref:BRCT domain-containing protein n=1 Tax=Lysinibacillus contaminans TaxID=1293441 RepID=A0ABR5JYS0_9BACI|nr:BRCT domain-containing protein [Lysinibacillus contaminans]KOS67791.1 hypothetical protein AEA09_03945 [Lysinibacillus contaminans]